MRATSIAITTVTSAGTQGSIAKAITVTTAVVVIKSVLSKNNILARSDVRTVMFVEHEPHKQANAKQNASKLADH